MNADRQRENNAALFNSDAQSALASAERVHLSPQYCWQQPSSTPMSRRVASQPFPHPHLICRIKKLRARLLNAAIHQMEVKPAPFAISSWEGERERGGRQGECAHEGISANVDELQRLPAALHCTALHCAALRCWSSEHGRILSHMRQNIALPDRRARRVLIPDPPDQRR